MKKEPNLLFIFLVVIFLSSCKRPAVQGDEAQIVVNESTIDFGLIEINQSKRSNFTLTNSGDTDATLVQNLGMNSPFKSLEEETIE